jgi:hypothetical protein
MLILCSIIYGPNGHEYDDLCGLSQTMYNQSMFLHLPELATNFIPCHSLCLALPNVNLNLFGILSWQVKRRNSEESSTQWTTGIAEIQLPIEYKLRNIEETEAAKKVLQEKRLMGRTKSEFTIPASYSADYFQRGRDYAEKLRREHPELYKDRSLPDDGAGSKQTDTSTDAPGQRQAATDQFMLERFRKRERHRVMRR